MIGSRLKPELRPATRIKSATTIATPEATWLWVSSSCSYDSIGLLPPGFGPGRLGSAPGGVSSSIGGRGGEVRRPADQDREQHGREGVDRESIDAGTNLS